jgi:hypothetical protein
MAVELTHVGEAIVARMIEALRLRFLDLCDLSPCADEDLYRSTRPIVFANVGLHPYSSVGFDGASRVDLVVLLKEDLGVPFELKLGETRLTKSRVDEEWLSGCKRSHQNKRFSGNMMSVLERKFPPEVPKDSLKAKINGRAVTLTDDWFVIARKRVVESWTGLAKPAFSARVRFMPFESIVGECGGKASFNSMVRELLTIDYFSAWVSNA